MTKLTLSTLVPFALIVLFTGCATVQTKPTVEVVPVGVPYVARLDVDPGHNTVAVQSATSPAGPWTTIYTSTNRPNRIDIIDHNGTGSAFYKLTYP